jgi:hypothetical protein
MRYSTPYTLNVMANLLAQMTNVMITGTVARRAANSPMGIAPVART